MKRAWARSRRFGCRTRPVRLSFHPPFPDETTKLPRQHVPAPSLKIQTIEHVREYLSHYALYVDGEMRVVGYDSYLALRVAPHLTRDGTLDTLFHVTVAKCGGQERALVAFENVSLPLESPIKGHAQKLWLA